MGDPRAPQGQCGGLCTAPWGGSRAPHGLLVQGFRAKETWAALGGFRENIGAVGCSLELSPALGRLDSSCFPSSVSPGPVCADTRVCPQASPC